MRCVTLFLLLQYLLFFEQYKIIVAKPFIGNNVRRARENEFSFVVSISAKTTSYDALRDHICTGTLISKQHVVTAEHCMRDDLSKHHVLVGHNDLYKAKSYDIKKWISYVQWIQMNHFHLEYDENDISMITLQKCIEEPEIEPAVLTTKTNKELYGEHVVLAGWGRTNTQRLAILMETTMTKVLTRKECLKRVTKLSPLTIIIPDSVICSAAEQYVLMDCGESGGPLLDTNNILVAVNEGTSPLTREEFHPGEVNVHSSINYYKHFIQDIILHSD